MYQKVPLSAFLPGNQTPLTFRGWEQSPMPDMVPAEDPHYIHRSSLLSDVLTGLTQNIPMFLYGMQGTSKTSVINQVAAKLNWHVFALRGNKRTDK